MDCVKVTCLLCTEDNCVPYTRPTSLLKGNWVVIGLLFRIYNHRRREFWWKETFGVMSLHGIFIIYVPNVWEMSTKSWIGYSSSSFQLEILETYIATKEIPSTKGICNLMIIKRKVRLFDCLYIMKPISWLHLGT